MGPKALRKSVRSVCQSARTERETLQGEWELADGVRRNSPDKEQHEWKRRCKKKHGTFGEMSQSIIERREWVRSD